jgi:integrase
MATRRPYGTGTLYQKAGSWYGRWLVGERRMNRMLGPVREDGTRDGLTRSQAERELRRRMEQEYTVGPATARLTVSEASERLVDHLEAVGRKPTTITVYRSLLRTHIARHLGDRDLDRVESEHVERMIAAMRRGGTGPKTTVNAITLLAQVFEHGQRRGWCAGNPCARVDRPRLEDDIDIHFLSPEEVEALLRAVPEDDVFGPTDRALYLAAVASGLRQGELLALRWRDIDWAASRIRVRRNYVRGHWGTPKSRRSTRAVPMIDRLAGELDRHHQRSHYQGDDDLVFPHPHTGVVLGHSQLVRRFKRARDKAGVRRVRFHDLRHSFAVRMAAAGVPMRTLQEWLGHRDYKTTLRYADYAPSAHEGEMAERAFSGTVSGTELSETETISEHLKAHNQGESEPTDTG